jgi:hypothetical protein
MNKTFILPILALIVISAIGIASAIVPICATVETTYVSGIVTDATQGDAKVSGADVTVTCNGNVETTTSGPNGNYSVQYAPGKCDSGDTVSVSANYGSLNGDEQEKVTEEIDQVVGCLEVIVNVACVDVPLIPEFGIIAGTLTMAMALVVFLVVRKK